MSTATDTVATPTQVTYKTLAANVVQAPRDKNNEAMIDIRLDQVSRQATCACLGIEHVGTHKQRKVGFTASDDCILHFTDKVVFGRESIDLFKGKSKWLPVDDSIINATTSYYVTTDKAVTADLSTTQPTIMVPPQIVVP